MQPLMIRRDHGVSTPISGPHWAQAASRIKLYLYAQCRQEMRMRMRRLRRKWWRTRGKKEKKEMKRSRSSENNTLESDSPLLVGSWFLSYHSRVNLSQWAWWELITKLSLVLPVAYLYLSVGGRSRGKRMVRSMAPILFLFLFLFVLLQLVLLVCRSTSSCSYLPSLSFFSVVSLSSSSSSYLHWHSSPLSLALVLRSELTSCHVQLPATTSFTAICILSASCS